MKFAETFPGQCSDDGGTNLANCDEDGSRFVGPCRPQPFASSRRLGAGCIEPFPPYEVGTIIPTFCPTV